MATKDLHWIYTLELKKKKKKKTQKHGLRLSGGCMCTYVTWSWFHFGKRAAGDPPSPLSTMIRGISFSAGEEHLIRFPSTKPFISARSSKVQLTPAESSGTLWASNTSWKKPKRQTPAPIRTNMNTTSAANTFQFFKDKVRFSGTVSRGREEKEKNVLE